jgi:ABC-type multidrug transport system fused ATPase/permease subunit
MSSFGEIFFWFMPFLLGGFVSLMGVLAMLYRRIDSDRGWEVTGPATVLLGFFALPVLPLVVLLNPTLSQRAARRQERDAEARKDQELRDRLAAVKERRKALAAEGAEEEDRKLRQEESQLTRAETQARAKALAARWEASADKAVYLVPFAWGGTLYGLAWLLGRPKKPGAEETPDAPRP